MSFSRSRRAATPTSAQSAAVAPASIAVAAPDTVNLLRGRSLRLQQGLGLQGQLGGLRGYDRGDPAHSITGPITRVQTAPATAQAAIGYSNAQRRMPTPEDGHTSSHAELAAYKRILLARSYRASR